MTKLLPNFYYALNRTCPTTRNASTRITRSILKWYFRWLKLGAISLIQCKTLSSHRTQTIFNFYLRLIHSLPSLPRLARAPLPANHAAAGSLESRGYLLNNYFLPTLKLTCWNDKVILNNYVKLSFLNMPKRLKVSTNNLINTNE
jgi:hypothetical protein